MADENIKPQEQQEPTPNKVEENNDPNKLDNVDPNKVDPKKERNELLRELSKEYGVNLFDAEGLKKFKEYTESQKTEQEKLQEQLSAYEQEKAQWQSAKLQYEAKLKASELGIAQDKLEDALKLAEGDPEKLPDIIKKYPVFKSKEGVRIGLQDPVNNQRPTGMSEVEEYMSKDPRYKAWLERNKK